MLGKIKEGVKRLCFCCRAITSQGMIPKPHPIGSPKTTWQLEMQAGSQMLLKIHYIEIAMHVSSLYMFVFIFPLTK